MEIGCFTGVTGKSTLLNMWLKCISASQYRLHSLAMCAKAVSCRTFNIIGVISVWIFTTLKTYRPHPQWKRQIRYSLTVSACLAAISFLGGCSNSTLTTDSNLRIDANSQWILLPVANYTASPQAGDRMEAILTTLLQVRGVRNIQRYQPLEEMGAIPILDTQQRSKRALAWAQNQNIRYGFTGSVEEWRYKSGVEREPAVGLSLRVVDIATGDVLWAASGARAGWGRETISGTAQKLLAEMLEEINFKTAG